MSKKQATKAVKETKAINEAEFSAEVEACAEFMRNLIDVCYPQCDELKYARERMAENLVWRADRDYEFQVTKVAESQERLDNAVFEETAIREKLQRESVDEPNTTVYDSRRERAAQWHERMEMQMCGAARYRDGAILCRDTLSD
tara:strand:+ start:100 stop:531 length:432 start_codon:yes stop_codon:yes gene_type:complete